MEDDDQRSGLLQCKTEDSDLSRSVHVVRGEQSKRPPGKVVQMLQGGTRVGAIQGAQTALSRSWNGPNATHESANTGSDALPMSTMFEHQLAFTARHRDRILYTDL